MKNAQTLAEYSKFNVVLSYVVWNSTIQLADVFPAKLGVLSRKRVAA
jgi:hypothetical protein